MQFFMNGKSAALLAALIALVQSAPVDIAINAPVSPRDTINVFQPDAASTHQCGNYDYENKTSGGSPLVSDCQQLARNIAGNGKWTLGESNQRALAGYGECVFGAEVQSGFMGYVGNQDIIDVINGAISRFQSGGRIGARGIMHCGNARTEYGIYHHK